jgi:hypothetical protein
MRQFKARREPRSEKKTFFEHGRDEYLAAKVAPHVEPRRFCNALEEIHAPLGNLYKRSGYPWITLVLGSGCLEAGLDISGTRIHDVPAIVQKLLAHQDPLPDGTNAAKLAAAFAASLIADRLGPPAAPTDGSAEQATGDPSNPRREHGGSFDTTDLKTAKLLLCAALLTRLYHLASAAAPDALSRTGHDRVSLPAGQSGSAELQSNALAPVLALLGELIASTDPTSDSGDAVLHQALTTIDSSLNSRGHQPSLRVADIQLLTELCWYSLTQDTSVYPGWNDLLLHLSTRTSPALFDRWLPRPAFDDIDAACWFVQQRYEATTKLSWNQLVDDDETEREQFYATVAGILRQQAALRHGFLQSSPLQPPIASAFVTSFDLELEMAMWRSSTEPFVVAVPMNLLQDVAEQATCLASVCWLGCLIRPDHDLTHEAQLEKLCAPAEEDWFLLNGDTAYELAYGNYPVIVRLSGSPLMSAPRLWTEDGSDWNDLCRRLLKDYHIEMPGEPPDRNEPELRMAHVALLDEYSAMQHAASEFLVYQPDRSNERVRQGLPAALFGTRGSAFARFWMMMGVQVSDSSIRYRFASQMTVPTNIDGESVKKAPTPSRAGLVVNWRTDDTVRDLLGWYNFDVVTDRCENFQADLQHYLRHLQSTSHRPAARRRCELA